MVEVFFEIPCPAPRRDATRRGLGPQRPRAVVRFGGLLGHVASRPTREDGKEKERDVDWKLC